jgi:hypothetical protein
MELGREALLAGVVVVFTARAAPLAIPFSRSPICLPGCHVATAVPAAAMVVTSACTRTHPHTHPRACAPAHVFAWEGENPTFFLSVLLTEPSSPAFRHREPRCRHRGDFPPGGASVGTFLNLHARSRARTHSLSPTPATPAVPPRPRSAARGCVMPLPYVCCSSRGRRPCLRA